MDHLMSTVARAPLINAAPPPAPSPEIKEIADKLSKAFEDYKQANDARLKAVEKLGTETPELRSAIEKADHTIEELKAQMEAAVAAQKKGLEDLELRLGRAGLGGGGASDERRQAAARFMTTHNILNKNNRRVSPDDPDLDLEAYANYCNAFADAARRQFNMDSVPANIRNAMSIGSDPDGGFLVPGEMSTEMERRIHDTSPMRQIARVITIGGPTWEAPYKSSKGVSGGWVGEKSARPATGTAQVGMQRIETHEQYAYPEVTQSMLDDAAINIEEFLVEDTEDEMSRTENLAYVSGTGVLQPKGILAYGAAAVTTPDATRAWGTLQYIASGAAGAWADDGGTPPADNANPLVDTIAALHPNYRDGANWAMNRTVEASVRKLKDRDGRYLVGFGDLRDSVTGFSILGFPIVNLEDMPNLAADSYSIAFGNFRRGYYIVDRIGFRVLRDPYTNKPYVGFYITKRTGGDVRNFDAIKLIKFASS